MKGKAGFHKHKWSYTLKYEPERLGKQGFKPPMKSEVITINVGKLDGQVKNLLDNKLAEKTKKAIKIDLNRLGYNKLLGKGKVTHPLIIQLESCSESAVEKIEKAGGKILNLVASHGDQQKEAISMDKLLKLLESLSPDKHKELKGKEGLTEDEVLLAIQEAYNVEHDITPETVKRAIDELMGSPIEADYSTVPLEEQEAEEVFESLEALDAEVAKLEGRMHRAAEKLEFEEAAQLRDRIRYLRERAVLA